MNMNLTAKLGLWSSVYLAALCGASLVILGVIGFLRKPKNKAVENQASKSIPANPRSS